MPGMAKFRPLLAEFIGTFALIFVGVGASKTVGHDALAVALAHGLTIAAFASATMHISGGQFNPAVTFGLVCGGHMAPAEAIRYWIAQLLGGVAAAFVSPNKSAAHSKKANDTSAAIRICESPVNRFSIASQHTRSTPT